MESIFLLAAFGYLVIAPIALIIAIVALIKARRGGARLQALEAENSQFEKRLSDLVQRMAAPDAEIYDFDARPPAPTSWNDLEHVQLTRDFLNRPDAFLRHL